MEAIAFVIDTTDRERAKYVKSSIEDLFKDEIVRKKKMPIIFMFNKCDEPESVEKD